MVTKLNETLERKDIEIAVLQDTVHDMNASLSALTAVVEQMMRATSFATTRLPDTSTNDWEILTDCMDDVGNGPCSQTRESSATASSYTAFVTPEYVSMAPLPDVAVAVCESYPCSDASVDVFAWSAPVVVVVSVDTDVEQFKLTLLTVNGDVVWQQFSSSRFASFVPSDVGATPGETYHLQASVELQDGRSADAANATALRFASPPTLNGVTAVLVNTTAAANWFEIVVDATDGTELWYEYFVVATDDDSWKYLVAEGYDSDVVVAAPSTRNFTLEVTATNVFGSSASCEHCATLVRAVNATLADAASDALKLVGAGAAETCVLLAAIDSAGDDYGSTAAAVLELLSEAMIRNDTVLSQDIVVLHALASTGGAAHDGFADALQAVGVRIASATTASMSVSLYLDTVDAFGAALVAQSDVFESVAEMDEYLATVCSASTAGQVPDGGVSVFQQESVSLSCASSEDVVAIDAGAATVLAAVDGVATVAVSAWNGTMNTTNTSSFLSSIYGVHVDGGRAEGDAIEVDRATTLKLSVSGSNSAIRKSMSCVYYAERTGKWISRGVVLRGLEFDEHNTVRAICTSSHLTLFTVDDTSEAARVVESKIAAFAARVDSMNSVNFLDDGTAVNWNIMGSFVGVTVFFVLVIVVAKLKGRKAAVNRGRLTFQQDGVLSKPNVIGSAQYEAILRRWVSAKDTAKLIVFELLTSNAVLGLLFHWDHEAVVFGRADKASILLGAILMTFVSSAFLFDPNEGFNDNPVVAIWSTLVSAALTNVLLLPVQHFLPYMVSNVNSLTTLTEVPTSLLKRELRRHSCWRPPRRRQSNRVVRSMTLMNWVASTSKSTEARKEFASGVERIAHVSTELRFGQCTVELPATTVSGEQRQWPNGMPQANLEVQGIVTFQRLWRANTRLKRAVRNLEFSTWYGLRKQRHILAVLSTAVLVVVATFTMTVCLYLSCAFNDAESAMWVADVSQSLILQVFVTEPAITLLVLCAKLLVSWVLLRIGKKRLKKQLREQEDEVTKQILTVSTRVELAASKAKALRVVAGGVTSAVAQEKAAKMAEKQQCMSALEGIAAAKGHLTQLRRSVARPKRLELETWGTRESQLNHREQQTKGSLQAIDAALDILGGNYDDAQQQLREAQDAIMELKQKLMKMEKESASLRRERAKVEDKTVAAVKPSAIAPLSGQHGEPCVQRAQMPTLRRAVRLCDEVCSAGSIGTAGCVHGSARRPQGAIHARTRGLRPRRRLTARRSSAVSSPSRRNGGTAMPSRRRARKPRAMTWAEITALQRALKAKAAQSAAKVATQRRGPRTGKGFDCLSPKAMKFVLERREQRRRQLARRSARQTRQQAGTAAALETVLL